jgi:polyhydroxybutyrate depolymerase
MIRNLMAAIGLALFAGPALADCDNGAAPCQLTDGEYSLALPSEGGANPPVVMFLHGAGSNGANVLKNKRVVGAFLRRGYAVLAPTGARSFGGRNGRSWNFFPGWEGRDETDFLQRVVADSATRFGTSPDRVLLAGFSAGAFMVSYLACESPVTFSAYAPVSGGFWRPQPASCAGPVRLFQTHGWSDKTVPLEGRYLHGKEFQQGDIFSGLEIWRAANGCVNPNPDSFSTTGDFMRRKWSGCAPGSALEMALFPGGHTVPKGWSDMVLDWFENASAS